MSPFVLHCVAARAGPPRSVTFDRAPAQTLADAPWTLTTTKIEQVDDAEVRSVQGFTFYPEERK